MIVGIGFIIIAWSTTMSLGASIALTVLGGLNILGTLLVRRYKIGQN